MVQLGTLILRGMVAGSVIWTLFFRCVCCPGRAHTSLCLCYWNLSSSTQGSTPVHHLRVQQNLKVGFFVLFLYGSYCVCVCFCERFLFFFVCVCCFLLVLFAMAVVLNNSTSPMPTSEYYGDKAAQMLK